LFLIKREPGDRFARQIYVTVVQAEESVARVYPAEDQGLVRLAYVTTASQVIAEDVVQQVFTDVYRPRAMIHIRQYRLISNVTPPVADDRDLVGAQNLTRSAGSLLRWTAMRWCRICGSRLLICRRCTKA